MGRFKTISRAHYVVIISINLLSLLFWFNLLWLWGLTSQCPVVEEVTLGTAESNAANWLVGSDRKARPHSGEVMFLISRSWRHAILSLSRKFLSTNKLMSASSPDWVFVSSICCLINWGHSCWTPHFWRNNSSKMVNFQKKVQIIIIITIDRISCACTDICDNVVYWTARVTPERPCDWWTPLKVTSISCSKQPGCQGMENRCTLCNQSQNYIVPVNCTSIYKKPSSESSVCVQLTAQEIGMSSLSVFLSIFLFSFFLFSQIYSPLPLSLLNSIFFFVFRYFSFFLSLYPLLSFSLAFFLILSVYLSIQFLRFLSIYHSLFLILSLLLKNIRVFT